MGRIVAMMDDLFFQMKVAETAKHLGLELKVATNGDALLGLLEPAPNLVIVDLNARSQPIAVIEKLRQTRKDVRVVAFLSHVQTELAAQAQENRDAEVAIKEQTARAAEAEAVLLKSSTRSAYDAKWRQRQGDSTYSARAASSASFSRRCFFVPWSTDTFL